MGIVAKNIIVNDSIIESRKEEVTPPSRFVSIHDKLRQPIVENVKPVAKAVVEEPKQEESHYHDIHDGELHKRINKKSEYLNDMIGFKI